MMNGALWINPSKRLAIGRKIVSFKKEYWTQAGNRNLCSNRIILDPFPILN